MGEDRAQRSLLMGDIVGSEQALPQEALHARFNAAVDAQNTQHRRDLVSPLTITLGDEFQGLAASLMLAARIARDLRLELLAEEIDCRFVIGQVSVKTPINPERAWNMMGPGFGRARDKLNEKKPDMFYRFSLDAAPVAETLLDAIGAALSGIERSWTDRQRADITALITGLTPAELARKRNVTVHNIYKVRASGDFNVYSQGWQAVETALGALDAGQSLG